MTLNHIGTMTSIGFEGDNYDRMSVRGDDFDQANTSMVNNLYNSSSAMAICRRNSPSPPPFLSPPTQTTGKFSWTIQQEELSPPLPRL